MGQARSRDKDASWFFMASIASEAVLEGGRRRLGKASRGSPALVAQGTEHRFPNPKFYMAKNGKRWEIRRFTGSKWAMGHSCCGNMEQHWSKSEQ